MFDSSDKLDRNCIVALYKLKNLQRFEVGDFVPVRNALDGLRLVLHGWDKISEY